MGDNGGRNFLEDFLEEKGHSRRRTLRANETENTGQALAVAEKVRGKIWTMKLKPAPGWSWILMAACFFAPIDKGELKRASRS